MDFNCVDMKTNVYSEISKDNVFFLYKGGKYQLLVHSDQGTGLEWEMMGSVNAASNFLKQFGFVRLDTNIIANSEKLDGRSKEKLFGKYKAYFTDGSSVGVSRTAYDLYLKHLPLVE
jgi:DNA-binding LytR/AlgR family response regulator